MPSIADVYMRVRVEPNQVKRDAEEGLNRVDTRKAGLKAGADYGDGLNKGASDGLNRAAKGSDNRFRDAGKSSGGVFGDTFARNFSARVGPRSTAALGKLGDGKATGTGFGDSFAKNFLAKLGPLRAQIDKDLASKELKIRVDAAKAQADLAKLTAEVAKATGDKTIKIEADTLGGVVNARKAGLEFDRIARNRTAGFNVDAGAATAKAGRFNALLNRVARRRVANIDTDTAAGSAKVGRFSAAMNRAARRRVANMNVDTGAGTVKAGKFNALLNRVARRRTAHINVDVDRSSLSRATGLFGGAGGDAGHAFNKGLKDGGGGGAAGGAGGGLGGGGFMSPGLIAGLVALGLAVLPGAFAAAGALGGVALGSAFAIRGSKALQNQAKSLLHGLDKMMVDAARVLIKPLNQAMNVLRGQLPVIGRLFSQTFSAVAPLVTPIVKMLTGLVINILPGFNALMRASAGPLAAFFVAVGKIVGSGFGDFFKAIIPAVRPSLDVIVQLLKLFVALLPLIATLSNVFARIFSPVLRLLVTVVNTLVPPLTLLINGVFKAMLPILPVIVHLITLLATILAGVLTKAITIILPILTTLVNGVFKALAPVLPVILNLIGQLATLLLGVLGKAIVALLPPLLQLVQSVFGVLQVILPILVPIIGRIATIFGGLLVTAIRLLLPPLLQLVQMLLPPLLKIIVAILPIAETMAGTFGGILMNALKQLLPSIVQLVLTLGRMLAVLLPLLVPMIKVAAQLLVWEQRFVIGPVINIAIGVIKILIGVLNTLVGWFINVIHWVKQVPGAFVTAWNFIKKVSSTIWNGIKGVISGVWNWLVAAAKTVWNVIKGVILGVWNGLQKAASTVWNGIKGIVGGVWNFLKTAATVVWRGIRGVIEGVWNALKKTASVIWNGIKGVIAGVWNFLQSAAKTIWNVTRGIIEGVWNALKKTASVIWNGIKGIVTGVWNFLQAAGKRIWNTIRGIIEGVWNALKKTASVIWNGIKGILAGVWNFLQAAAKRVWNVTRGIIEGVWNAIKKSASTIWNGIKGIIAGVWGWLRDTAKSVWNITKGIIFGVWNSIKSTSETIWNKIKDGISRIWNGIKEIVRTPLNFVIDIINTFTDPVNAVLAFIGVKGKGTHDGPIMKIPHVKKFATGGIVRDGTSETADDVLVRVSKRETIVSAAHSRMLAPAFGAVGVPGYAKGGTPGLPPGFTLESSYTNPLAHISGLIPMRIDQGVDYGATRTSPLTALGAGTMLGNTNPGWPGGQFWPLRLSEGPLAGANIFYAEHIRPVVRKGQKVKRGQHIFDLIPGSPNMEIGFALPDGSNALAKLPEAGGYREGQLTAIGDFMNTLLMALGAPGGTRGGRSVTGKVPGSLPHDTASGWSGFVKFLKTVGKGALGLVINRVSDLLQLALPEPLKSALPRLLGLKMPKDRKGPEGLGRKLGYGGLGFLQGKIGSWIRNAGFEAIKKIPIIGDLISAASAAFGGGGGGGGPLGGATGSATENLKQVALYMSQNGYTKFAGAGIAGNVYRESLGNPFSVGSGGRGLIGWTPPGTISDADFKGGMKTQLPAILRYNQQWRQYIPMLNNSKSPGQASDIYVKYFERAGVVAGQQRRAAAERIYNTLWGPGGSQTKHDWGGTLRSAVYGLDATGKMHSFAENGPERIVPGGSDPLLAELQRLNRNMESLPGRTAAGVAKAIKAPAGQEATAARIGARG